MGYGDLRSIGETDGWSTDDEDPVVIYSPPVKSKPVTRALKPPALKAQPDLKAPDHTKALQIIRKIAQTK